MEELSSLRVDYTVSYFLCTHILPKKPTREGLTGTAVSWPHSVAPTHEGPASPCDPQVPLLPEGLTEPPHSMTAPEGKLARALEILYSEALSWLKPHFCFWPKNLPILCSIMPHKQQSRVARHSRSYGGVSVGGNIEIMDTIMHAKPFQLPKLVEQARVSRTLFSKNFFPRQRTHRVDRSLVRIVSWWVGLTKRCRLCPTSQCDSSLDSSLEFTSSQLWWWIWPGKVLSLRSCSELGSSRHLDYRNNTLIETSVLESCMRLNLVLLKHHRVNVLKKLRPEWELGCHLVQSLLGMGRKQTSFQAVSARTGTRTQIMISFLSSRKKKS